MTIVGRHATGSVALLLGAIQLAACTGTIDSDELAGLTPEEQAAQTAWLKKALPVFKSTCAMCHDGSMPDIGYLAGDSDLAIRDTLIAYQPPLVNFNAPQSSRMLSKGMHEGPALTANQASDVLAWITAQRDAMPLDPGVETAQVTPMLCNGLPPPCPVNTIDLTSAGLPGATLTFEAQGVGSDIYLSAIQVTAGADGAYLAHPLVDSWPAGATAPTQDPNDRYFNVVFNVMDATPTTLGTDGGFAGLAPADPISFHFDVVDKYRPPQ